MKVAGRSTPALMSEACGAVDVSGGCGGRASEALLSRCTEEPAALPQEGSCAFPAACTQALDDRLLHG